MNFLRIKDKNKKMMKALLKTIKRRSILTCKNTNSGYATISLLKGIHIVGGRERERKQINPSASGIETFEFIFGFFLRLASCLS